jgi:hypothetical protein
MQETFSAHLQGALGAHSGNIPVRTFRECSMHVQGSFSAHSGNIQCVFRERSVKTYLQEEEDDPAGWVVFGKRRQAGRQGGVD